MSYDIYVSSKLEIWAQFNVELFFFTRPNISRIFGEEGKENGRKSWWWHTGMWQLRGSFTSARGRILTTLQRSRLLFSLSPFHGVAVQVTSITRTLNARRVPTSTSFCSPRDRCEIYLDSNIATEIPTYCRAQLLCFWSNKFVDAFKLWIYNYCLLPLRSINKL